MCVAVNLDYALLMIQSIALTNPFHLSDFFSIAHPEFVDCRFTLCKLRRNASIVQQHLCSIPCSVLRDDRFYRVK